MSGASPSLPDSKRDDPQREAWLQRLSEGAALPAGDPRRSEIEAEVRARGPWAIAHWQALLEEGLAWRAALPDIEAPAELAARLRVIPAQHPLRARRTRRLLWATAAGLLLAVGLAVWLGRSDEPAVSPEISEVALLALSDHLDTHTQDVLSSDPAVLQRDLQRQIPFPISLPSFAGVLTPIGGRRCTLGSHAVAFTAWQGRGGRLTLIQLRRGDFGLPADMAPQVVHPEGQAAGGRPLDVFFFGRGDTVWVVVADDAEDLRRVRRHVSNNFQSRRGLK